MHDNYQEVVHQMESFGIEFQPSDLPLVIDHPRRKHCGKRGKAWYWLRSFRPERGGAYIVGRFGSYKTGDDEKVQVDWRQLSSADHERLRVEREAAEARARELREQEARLAAMSAAELWREGSKEGHSAYLRRKGVEPEACRFLRDGSIVVPLLRYDLPREEALRAVQRIYPGPRVHRKTGEPLPEKVFTKGFAKDGCCVRLGDLVSGRALLVCEGYATGLSLGMALHRSHPVFVALDAHNLLQVVRILRELHPAHPILICADDDWQRRNRAGELENLGVLQAWKAAREHAGCYVTHPSFTPSTRLPGDTDFNDLHAREGLAAVSEQLLPVLEALDA